MTLGEYKSRLAGGQSTFTPMNGPQDQEIKDVINKTLSTQSTKPTTPTTSTTSQAKPSITPSKTTTSTTSMAEPKFSAGASLKDIMSYRMKTNPPSGSNSKPVSTTSTSSMNNIGSSSNSGIGGTTNTSSTTSTTPKFSIK